jgi:hypothetical protein
MKVDWNRKADARSIGEIASTLRQARSGLESALESISAEGAAPSESDRLYRLNDALDDAQPAVPKGDESEIKKEVLAGARSGLAKVNQGAPPEQFTLGEHIGLEAVILTNGERPCLFVRDGFIDLSAPDIGDWKWSLDRFRNEVRNVTTSVGRVDVPVKPWFAGTCFVVAQGLAVTNRHVLEAIAKQDGAGAWVLNWPDATTIDFNGEDSAADSTKFTVTGVAFAGPDPIDGTVNFSHLDMAILRIDPASDATHAFPQPVKFETNAEQPKARRDVYVVGFPGRPLTWAFGGRPPVRHETTEVISMIFNGKFGVKRLAPGIITAGPGDTAGDARKWICVHDASTLGGNSGSCVVDLSGDGMRIMGLHFAGINREQNWAHAVAQLQQELAGRSATFV